MSSPRDRRFAVVGCGSIGTRHLRNLVSLGCKHLVAVDADPAAAARAAAGTGAAITTTLAEALHAGADVVLVTTPTHLHVAPALEAVRAGAALFVEKPLAATLDGVDELVAEAARCRTTALVACNLRFHPGLVQLQGLARSGAIGTPLSARIEYGGWLPDWRPGTDYRGGYAARRETGGGIVLDAIHELDVARWLLGEPSQVACFAGKLSTLELETEDTAAILLRHPGGALAEVHLDYVQRTVSRTCQLVGEEGTLRWDWTTGETRLYEAATRAWTSFPAPLDWLPNQMYIAELEHFLACIAGDAEPVQDLAAGRSVLTTALAALESSEQGTVIALGGSVPPVALRVAA